MLIGVVDDVLIVGWLLNRIDLRLEGYRAWKYNDPDVTPS